MNKVKKVAIWIMSPIMLGCLSLGFAFNSPSQTAYADAQQGFTVDSCQVRLDAPTGMRFTASMTDSYYQSAVTGNGEDGKSVSFGMLVLPVSWVEKLTVNDYIPSLSAKLEGTDLTVDELTTNSLAFQNTDAQGNLVDANDTKWYIQGSLATVLYQNYNLDYTAIGFVKTTVGETTTYEYADFDENDYYSLTETASKSLNVAGYENNTTIQEFVKNGICQANGIAENDAENIEFTDLVESLNLSVGFTNDHVGVNETVTYSVVSNGTYANFDNLDFSVVSNDESVVKVVDGKLKAVGDGVATISVKNGQEYAESQTLYVGSQALALYNVGYNDNTRNDICIFLGDSRPSGGAAWGITQFSNTPGFVDVPTDVATAYQTQFGETLNQKAYYFDVDKENLDKNGKTDLPASRAFRLLELRFYLTDAKYVFDNYDKIRVKMYVKPAKNESDFLGNGVYLTKASDKHQSVLSGTASGSNWTYDGAQKTTPSGWMELTYPMPKLRDAYSANENYALTLGMDLRRSWEGADIYIASVEFVETNFYETFMESTPSKDGTNMGSTNWFGYGSNTSGAISKTTLTNDMAAAYQTTFGQAYGGNVYSMTPSLSNLSKNSAGLNGFALQHFVIPYSADSLWAQKFATATKICFRVYVQSSENTPIKTLAYTTGTTTSGLNANYVQSINVNKWETKEFKITDPAVSATNSKLEIAFILMDYFDVKDTASMTIYVESVWLA